LPLQKASVDLLNSPDKLTKVVQETNDRNEQVDTNQKKKRTEKKIVDIRNRGYKESKNWYQRKGGETNQAALLGMSQIMKLKLSSLPKK